MAANQMKFGQGGLLSAEYEIQIKPPAKFSVRDFDINNVALKRLGPSIQEVQDPVPYASPKAR